MTQRIYLGLKVEGDTIRRVIFKSDHAPTFADWRSGACPWNGVIGPFRTMRGARFMRDYGQGNPHCRCVADAERLAALEERGA